MKYGAEKRLLKKHNATSGNSFSLKIKGKKGIEGGLKGEKMAKRGKETNYRNNQKIKKDLTPHV